MNESSHIEERNYLNRLKNGEVDAFDYLYHRYKYQLAGNLFNLLKSTDLVEEMLQELFVRVWEKRHLIDPEKSFKSYVYRIGTNLVNDYFRRLAKDRELMQVVWDNIAQVEYPEALKLQLMKDKELMRTIEALPAQRKLVFTLCKLEGKSYAEVSRLLQISESAVNDHISRAHRFIFQHYDRSITLMVLIFSSILINKIP